ncbi:MAG: hypothetical protein M1167_05515 [Chloroflexi bacterium]|nr:hypothetical protein [Chloroflexota bacterium]
MAPLYLSFSWVLTVSYELFTSTAVKSIAVHVNSWMPSAGNWMNANVETIVFIYAFTWIFVLSSVIPQVILGKERSVLIQYVVVLILTLLAFYMADILQVVGGIQINDLLNAATFLTNPILAAFYLSVPYLFMIGLDIRSRSQRKKV